jgi:hypothetical protein
VFCLLDYIDEYDLDLEGLIVGRPAAGRDNLELFVRTFHRPRLLLELRKGMRSGL